jgi:glucosylceramidase
MNHKTSFIAKSTYLLLILAVVMALFASSVARPVQAAGETVSVWVTTPDQSKLLQQQADLTFAADSGSNPLTITVNPASTYQQMDGWGASLTDSSAWLIFNSSARNTIMNDLFNTSTGIGLSFLRQPIGASDFSRSGNYNFDNTCCDLNDFSISHDNAYIIPLLQQARSINPSVKVMISPWSPPGWMKTSGSMIGGGLNHAVYSDALAQYFVKSIQAYQAAGVPIYALTPQNEPLFSPAGYPGSLMSAGDQGQWIAYNLGPALANAGLGSVKIIAYDHNWDQTGYPTTVFQNSVANPYVAGVGWHCYGGNVSAQNTIHNSFPTKDTWLTECSGGNWAPYYNDFAANLKGMTENLIILNARYWSKSAVLWNMALDPSNGPTNGGCTTCRGVVTVNGGSYTKTVDYYILGHASKFVRSGAYRIASNTFGGNSIENVAFKNPDGSLVVIALNNASSAQTFKILISGQSVSYTLPAGAVATFKWTPGSTPSATNTPTPTSPSGTNIALNKAASSSSNETAAFTPNLAVDGNTTTRWSSAFSDPQWIQVDLGSTQNINRVVLNWEAAYGSAYQIQVSDAATGPWTNIFSTTTGNGATDDLTGLSGSGRYIRMNGTTRATAWGYSLFEFQVFGSGGITNTPTRTNTPVGPTNTPTRTPTVTLTSVPSSNLALNRPATSSSNETAAFTPNLAVDGNTTTRWSSAFSDPQWIQVDLGSTQNINRVVLNWEAAYGSAYQIQVSDAATGPWTNIFSTTTGNGATDDLTGLSGSGRYIRMNGTVRATAYGYSLWEFAVYGTGGSGPTNTPVPSGVLPRTGWTATASSTGTGETPGNALDGNAATRWSTGAAQVNGQWFQVDMGAVRTFNRIVLDAGASTGDYPRGYQVFVSNDGTNWGSAIASGTGTTQSISITFATQSARYLRIVQTGSVGNWWSIHELNVYN